MTLDSNILIIVFSLIIIASYIFNMISKWIKIPSVLLLISTGIVFQLLVNYFQIEFIISRSSIELMGTLGLILIVLEGSLDLKLHKDEIPNIKNAFFASMFILVATSLSTALVIQWWLNIGFKSSFVTAIPLAVTSSAIAIPSVSFLSKRVRDFIIYEATFSDILGILIFNYVIQDNLLEINTIKNFVVNIGIIILMSIGGSLLLLFLINKISGHIRFFIVLAILLLLYALGKMIHLPSLLLILIFGLLINNFENVLKGKLLKVANPEKLKIDLASFKNLTQETAFVIRTFFFVLFGYNVDLNELIKSGIFYAGVIIVAVSLIIRYTYLRFTVREADRFVKLFLAPRGLITVILFYSIPGKYLIPEFSIGIIFFVIIISGLLMTISLWLAKSPAQEDSELLENQNIL